MIKNLLLTALSLCLLTCRQESVPTHEIISNGVANPDRKWVQKEFFLSTFSAYPPDSANYESATRLLKEAGFNFVETAWKKGWATKSILEECDRQTFNVLAQDLDILGGFQGRTKPYHPDSVKSFLARYGSHPSLKSVYVSDEPIVEDNLIVRQNIDELERVRPDLLGFTVLLPSYYKPYAWTDFTQLSYDQYVDQHIAEVNPAILCTDYYPFQTSLGDTTLAGFKKSLFWKDMGLYRDRALKNEMPHWFYYQTVSLNKPDPEITPAHINVQAWSALMYGVKGLSTFTANRSVISKDGQKEHLFDAQKKLNQEIAALGPTLLNLKSTAVYHAEGQEVPDEYAAAVEKSTWIGSLPDHMSAGEFADSEGNNYILFVNKDFTTGHSFAIPLKSPARLYQCDKSNGGKQSVYREQTDELSLELAAGEGVLLRIEKQETTPRLISYQIK